MKLEINRIVKNTKAEGFGQRYCIWTQGCSIKCNGCFNREMLDRGKGIWVDVNSIIGDILSCPDIEGVTFLGGEPFDQAEAVSIIAREVRQRGFSVIVFTGFEYRNLINEENVFFKKLIQATDLLIDGKFDSENYDVSRPWTGSLNQKYIFLTDRYREEDLKKVKNRFEILLKKNGEVLINGMGDYKNLLFQLEKRGWKL